MKYIITFTVKGNGCFPLDMLRYGSFFPSDDCAVQQMFQSITFPLLRDKEYSIQLCCHTRTKTKENLAVSTWQKRWQSFGWRVQPDIACHSISQ